MEFKNTGAGVSMFYVEDDGTLSPVPLNRD